jgi:hypothetical protein
MVVLLESQSLERTTAFMSNLFLLSGSDLASSLFATLDFVTERNFQLMKASVSSTRLISGAAVGGIVMAILIVLSLYVVLHRRRKVIEIDEETVDEFDLPIEDSKELEIAVESGLEEENCLAFEDEDENWGRGGDELRFHLDGEESFSALCGRRIGESHVNNIFDRVGEGERLVE